MEGPIYGGYQSTEQDMDVRKGPWTVEEDSLLAEYVAVHGEGRWNAAANCAGLKRTGKSCRLRWLNYLCPNVRRGNISLQEQLLILELHSRWGNRWSKIAEYLPGRTDNEIKNYWRTRVQKLAKQLKCDVNSKQFRDTMRSVWMPRLMEQINASSSRSSSLGQPANNGNSDFATCYQSNQIIDPSIQETNENSGFSVSEGINSGAVSNFSPESFDTQVSLVLDTTDYPDSFQPSWNHPDILQTRSGSYPMGTESGYLDSWSVFGGEDSSVILESWWIDSEHEKSIWDL